MAGNRSRFVVVRCKKYRLVVRRERDGFALTVPGLPGCVVHCDTVEDALEAAEDAIESWLVANDDFKRRQGIDLTVQAST